MRISADEYRCIIKVECIFVKSKFLKLAAFTIGAVKQEGATGTSACLLLLLLRNLALPQFYYFLLFDAPLAKKGAR